jgi:hypothetical protein
MKHIELEIKSFQLSLIKNKAGQSVICQIQHWYQNHSHDLGAIYITDVCDIWPFKSLILYSCATFDGVFWLGTFIIFST